MSSSQSLSTSLYLTNLGISSFIGHKIKIFEWYLSTETDEKPVAWAKEKVAEGQLSTIYRMGEIVQRKSNRALFLYDPTL